VFAISVTAGAALIVAGQYSSTSSRKRRLVVIITDELQALADTDALVLLIKTKPCDLAVKRAVSGERWRLSTFRPTMQQTEC
jgi:hypothetical protein